MNPKTEMFWCVLRAQSGDREAMNRLFESLQNGMFRYIASLVQNQTHAEDVLQDVFVLIYRKIQWVEDPELFHSWAYRIATRESWRYLKRRKQWIFDEPASLDEQQARTHEEFPYEEWMEKLPHLLDQVSPASRAVLVLHFLNEMKLTEIAEVLEISIGTVKSRLHYGLSVLRKFVTNTSMRR